MIGHTANGGGACIKNSPIHVHIHIHGASESTAQKIARVFYGLIGQRHQVIEGADSAAEEELRRRVVWLVER